MKELNIDKNALQERYDGTYGLNLKKLDVIEVFTRAMKNAQIKTFSDVYGGIAPMLEAEELPYEIEIKNNKASTLNLLLVEQEISVSIPLTDKEKRSLRQCFERSVERE